MDYELMKQTRQHFSKIGLMYFLGSLIIMGIQLLVSFLTQTFAPSLLESYDTALLISMIPTYAVSMPLMMLLIRTIPAAPKKPAVNMRIGHWFITLLICFSGMYLSNILGNIITQLIGLAKGGTVGNDLLDIVSNTGIITTIVIMVILAPVMEELIFRKLLIDRIVTYGEGTAVLMSALFFGLFHGNLNQFAYAFVLGLIFGFIYVKTRTVRYTIPLHMVINFMGSVLSMIVLRASGYEELARVMTEDPGALTSYMMEALPGLMILIAYAFLLIGATIAGLVLFFVNLKKFVCYPGTVVIPKGKRFSICILNVGMILFTLYWLARIILQLFA